MKLSKAFPSKYLKADDLQGRRVSVVIESSDMEDIGGDGGEKLVLRFVGKDKGLVCNMTNANMIAEIIGSEATDDWSGQKIVLYATKVDFQGKRVSAIRIEAPEQPKKVPLQQVPGEDFDQDDSSF